MATIDGYLGPAPDGRLRIYRKGDAARFVDVDRADVERVTDPDTDLARSITLRDQASVSEGQLDQAAFEEHFDAAGAIKPERTLTCPTGEGPCWSGVRGPC